jgi:hypothetical protein
MFAASTDGTPPFFVEIPPGSLMRLPALGFVTDVLATAAGYVAHNICEIACNDKR